MSEFIYKIIKGKKMKITNVSNTLVSSTLVSNTLLTTSKIALVAAVMSTVLVGCNRHPADVANATNATNAAVTPPNTAVGKSTASGNGNTAATDTANMESGSVAATGNADTSGGIAAGTTAAGTTAAGTTAAGTTVAGSTAVVTTTPVTTTPVTDITLTDAQIEGILMAANTGEINAAKMAHSKSKNAKVKAFAQTMMKEHGDNNRHVAALSKQKKMPSAESDTSKMLKDNAEKEGTTLKALSGVEFDKAYIDAQVSDHETVLQTIDSSLIPNAKHAELKALLQKTRTAVAGHLERAKALQTAMK